MTKRKWFLLGMLVLGLSLTGLLVFNEVRGQDGEAGLCVVTYNMGTLKGNKPRLEAVVKVIRKKGVPDLVLLQEVPSELFAGKIATALGLEYKAYGTYKANGAGYGLAIVSKAPLFNAQMHVLKPYGHAALMADLKAAGGCRLVCSVHLERVKRLKIHKNGFQMGWKEAANLLKIELTQPTPRRGAVKAILDLLTQRACGPVIVGGDFNTVPFSSAVRAMERRFEDSLWPGWDYLAATYHKVNFPIKPRIDYIFHSPEMTCRAAGVIPEGPGDHYPVWARLRL